MTRSLNIHTYADVKDVLDAAVTAGGGRVRLQNASKAVNWRHRAYAFRSLMFKEKGSTPYDDFTLVLDGDSVVIRRKERAPLEDLEGNPIGFVKEEDTDLMDAARRLREKLMGEEG